MRKKWGTGGKETSTTATRVSVDRYKFVVIPIRVLKFLLVNLFGPKISIPFHLNPI